MSETTPNLALPLIMAAQAQKHVTHNEAIHALDALVHLAVLDRDLTAPPGSPAEGDRYIVKATATGAWAGQEDEVAVLVDGAWVFLTPKAGWVAFVVDENTLLRWSGSAWVDYFSGAALQNLALLGVNTTADATNKLAVKSAAVLFDNVGAGSQVKVNKAAAGDTASHLFQTGYSGRAEFGLAGDDDFHLKVSPDGSSWKEGITVDKTTGIVTFPSGAGEVGTFTPTASFATNGDFSPTYNVQDGDYLAIGKLVFVSLFIDFDTNAFTTASGAFRIGGLPFAARTDSTQTYFPMGLARHDNVTFSTSQLGFTVNTRSNFSHIEFSMLNSNANAGTVGSSQVPPSKAGVKFWLTGTYWRA